MRLRQLLDELERRDIVLEAADDRLEVDAPRGVVTPTIRQQLIAHKTALLAAIRARRAPLVCFACRGTAFWERPAEHGGGTVCSTCHPNPGALDASPRRQLYEASARSIEGEDRQALARWALDNGCPELRFRPWASVPGTPVGWLMFLRTASDGDAQAALAAAMTSVPAAGQTSGGSLSRSARRRDSARLVQTGEPRA